MAVDTRQKRFAMMSFGDGNNFVALFEADGAIDNDDRQHLLDLYSGVSFLLPQVGDISSNQAIIKRKTRVMGY
jgi:hypothetical protein